MSKEDRGACCVYCKHVKRGYVSGMACHMEVTEDVYYCKLKPGRAALASTQAFALSSACAKYSWRGNETKSA